MIGFVIWNILGNVTQVVRSTIHNGIKTVLASAIILINWIDFKDFEEYPVSLRTLLK